MTKLKQFFKLKKEHYFFAILSGLFVGTSYIPLPAWAVAFCYIPLWFTLVNLDEKNSNYQSLFTAAWITQFILTLIGFHWIYYTATEFGSLPMPLAAMALLLFCTFIHLYIPLSALFSIYIKRKFKLTSVQLIFTFALSLSLFERFWPSIFPWNLGYTLLWMKWPIYQWADVVGFEGLSGMIYLLQASLLVGYIYFDKNIRKSIAFTLIPVLIVVGLFITGKSKQKKWSTADSQFNALVVQGNIENAEKIAAEKGYNFQPMVLRTYIDLTETELVTHPDKPDAIIFPETALPFALDTVFASRPNQQILQKKIQTWNTTLITGGYSQDQTRQDHLGQPIIRNSIFFKGPQGDVSEPYFKTDLLVFGEYMPFGKELPFLYKLLPFVGVYEKGPGPVMRQVPSAKGDVTKIGPQICYESLNSDFARGLALAGADVIVNVTNDSWYGAWWEPYQHMTMNLGRAIEVRRPLIRATNTGISTAILANGKILSQSKMDKSWATVLEIPYIKSAEQTAYTRWGHFDFIIYILAIILIIAKGLYVQHKKS